MQNVRHELLRCVRKRLGAAAISKNRLEATMLMACSCRSLLFVCMVDDEMSGLHEKIKQKAQNGRLRLSELGPNSREVALRLIEQGKLIKVGEWYKWSEL